jgi:hypothetical protein
VRDACRVKRPDVLVRFRSGVREGEGAFGWRKGCGEGEKGGVKEKDGIAEGWNAAVDNVQGGSEVLGEGMGLNGFEIVSFRSISL